MNKFRKLLIIVLVFSLVFVINRSEVSNKSDLAYYVKVGDDYQYREYVPSSGYEYDHTKCNKSKYKKSSYSFPNSKIDELNESSNCDIYFNKIGEEGEESFSIIYELNGGVASNKESYKNTDEDFILNNPVKEGYNFIGWTGSNGSIASTSVTIKKGSGGNKRYKANYVPIKYSVVYDSNGGSGVINNSTHIYDVGMSLTKNVFVKENYSFIGWSKEKGSNTVNYKDEERVKNLTNVENGIVTLYAVWEGLPQKVNVTVLNGIINGETEKEVEYNKEVSFNFEPSVGYGDPIVSCTNNQSGIIENNVLKINNVTSDTSCSVEYKPLSYQIKYNANGGTGTMANSNHVYDESKALSSNTFIRVGYEFLGWSRNKDASVAEYTNGQSIKNLTTTKNEVIELYAIWKIKTYTASVTALNGTISGSTSKTANHGSDITFSLTANSGYGDPTVSCTNSQSGTMTGNTLTIKSISNNTTCTVTFNSVKTGADDLIAKYSSSNTEGLIKIDQPATVQTAATTEYRYSGANTAVKNYATFNGENWRIIGIFDVDDGTGKIEKRIKIIREASLGNYSWDSSASGINYGGGSNQWGPSGSYPGADLMQELNDTYYNSKSGTCYNSAGNALTTCNFTTTGLKEESRNMIDDARWYTGASTYSNTTSQQSYTKERSNTVGTADSGQSITKTSNWTGKIAIMYPSDYGYASNTCYSSKPFYSSSGSSYDYRSCTSTNWLYESSLNQWTLAPYESYSNYALYVFSTGSVGIAITCYAYATRPVAYLSSRVQITKGTGASNDRYEFSL